MINNFIKISIFLIIWICLAACAGAQKVTQTDTDNKTLAKYEQAKKDIRLGNYPQALKLLNEILQKYPDFTEGIIRKATVLHLIKEYDKSVEEYQKVINEGSEFDPEVYFSLALVYQDMKKYGAAAEMFDTFINQKIQDHKRLERAHELLEINRFRNDAINNPVAFNPIKLSGGVNSEYSEYTPSLSIDGNKLVFTRRINGQEDLYMCIKDGDQFGPAIAIKELNTHRNEGAHCISADGSIIIFTACDRTDSYGGCDLYYAVFENEQWTRPFNLGKRINTPAYEAQPSLSSDGHTLFFSSNRTGGMGGKDIWISHLDEDNRWSPPYNAGPAINSSGNDETPFIHADGSTLYFRTDGRLGMGNYDIFYSRWSENEEKWTDAVNLGFPVNTEHSEGGLTVSVDGKYAFFASDMAYSQSDPKANLDIYSFEMDPTVRPVPSTYVKGKITDKLTGIALSAAIHIVDLRTGKTKYSSVSDTRGRFITGMAWGREYACFVEKEGYAYYSHHFALPESDNPVIYYELDIKIVPIPKPEEPAPVGGETIILNNVFFDSGNATLLPQSNVEIGRLADLLMKYPAIKITITGHTDNVGKSTDNQILSENRAKAVANSLIEKGIAPTRISFQGKGETEPIASNATPEGRQKNRRTEFVISN